MDEDEGTRKKLELRARQLAIENHSLKNKFSEYGQGQPDLFSELGMGADEGPDDSDSADYLSSDNSDYEKVLINNPKGNCYVAISAENYLHPT